MRRRIWRIASASRSPIRISTWRRRSTRASTASRESSPGPSADSPYDIKAEPLPKSLAEALAALNDSACFRAGFGDAFVDYLLRIKQAEIARCDAETGGQSGNAAEVTAWEHNEYFDLA